MRIAANLDETPSHPFGGCNRLLDQYRTIGRALLVYEGGVCAGLISSNRSIREFSTSVSFVPVEVLETYLDDLLDLGVSDDGLFIRKSKVTWRGTAFLGTLAAAIVGACSVWHGTLAAALMPALLATTFLAGIASTLYFLPRAKVIRRFSFATLVSQEIASRRGHDRTRVGNFATRFLMGGMWKLQDYSASRPLPSHFARVGVRYYH